MRHVVRLAVITIALGVIAGDLPAQGPLRRFFILPDTSAAAGSDSFFAGIEGSTSYSVDFTEPLRLNRGGFVTLARDPGNPYVWNVVDFSISGTDLARGADLTFQRPLTPGPHGTWTSSDPNGFPDFSTATVSMSGELAGTGTLSGVFPATTTFTAAGTITPAYYHNVVLLNGAFSGIAGGAVALYMKADFYPPAVKWEMVARADLSNATVVGAPTPYAVTGGFSMQRGILDRNVYAVMDLAMTVAAPTPILITMPAAPNAGVLTFDPATRGLSGALSVLVDGIPTAIPVDGMGESFLGCVMHPTAMVIEDATLTGTIAALHLELALSELVPSSPPTNNFQIGVTTSLVMRGIPGRIYGCAATFTPLPGINTPVGDVPVVPDDLFFISIDPLNPYFTNNVGVMPASGETLINISIPNEPMLIGATFFLGGATLDPTTLAVLAATNSHRATVN
jgi:hypothetical protein